MRFSAFLSCLIGVLGGGWVYLRWKFVSWVVLPDSLLMFGMWMLVFASWFSWSPVVDCLEKIGIEVFLGCALWGSWGFGPRNRRRKCYPHGFFVETGWLFQPFDWSFGPIWLPFENIQVKSAENWVVIILRHWIFWKISTIWTLLPIQGTHLTSFWGLNISSAESLTYSLIIGQATKTWVMGIVTHYLGSIWLVYSWIDLKTHTKNFPSGLQNF